MLRAFTLIETLIVMALLTVIALLGYYLYRNGQQQFYRLQDAGEQTYEQTQQLHVIEHDRSQSILWVWQNGQIQIHRDNGTMVRYWVYSDQLILEHETVRDTLPVREVHMEYVPETQLVRLLSFEWQVEGEWFPYLVEKHYSAVERMMYEDQY